MMQQRITLPLVVFLFSLYVHSATALTLSNRYGVGTKSEDPYKAITPGEVDEIRREAHAGKVESQYYYGLLLLYGDGVDEDVKEGVHWLTKAATHGHLESQAAVGILLVEGKKMGVSIDIASGYHWLKEASGKGHIEAMWQLGRLYYGGKVGDGITNHAEAAHWFNRVVVDSQTRSDQVGAGNEAVLSSLYQLAVMHEYGLGGLEQNFYLSEQLYDRASQGGFNEATYNLGLLYAWGRGIPQDYEKAATTFEKSANRAHAPSQLFLGAMFIHGQGVPVNYDLSLVWLQKAYLSGDERVEALAKKSFLELQKQVDTAKAYSQKHQQYYIDLGRESASPDDDSNSNQREL